MTEVWYAWTCSSEPCHLNAAEGIPIYALAPMDREPRCPKCGGGTSPHMPVVVHDGLCNIDRGECSCVVAALEQQHGREA